MLTGKTAIVTGGSRGIGAAIAKKFASLGAEIAILYAGNAEAAGAVCAQIQEQYGVKAMSYRVDVSDFEQCAQAVAQIRSDFEKIDILVNNAGINRDGLVLRMKESDFDAVIGTNLKGCFNMIRHVSPLMLRKKSGKIINISSVAGLIGNAGQANYAASKAGVIGLTKSVARELAPRGICVNAIAPGFIQTDMTAEFDSSNPLVASIPMGRMGKPEDIAQMAAFLAGEDSDYITGEVFRVDGGLGM